MTTPDPLWTRDDVDQALARLESESDGISAGLMALDEHPGRRLLEGAALEGRTRDRWAACRADIARLWELYAAYGAVLADVRALRARRARPSRAELDEMARLLSGPSIPVPGVEVSIAQRDLVDPQAGGRRVTFDALVTEMNQVWRRATELVAAVDEVWTQILPRLDRVEASASDAAALVDRLGGAAALAVEARVVADVRKRLDEARHLVAADPLRFAGARPDARIGTVDLAALDRDIAGVRDGLRQLKLLQERYEERMQRIAGLVDVLAADEAEGRRRRAHVSARIAHGVPEIPVQAPPLRARAAQVAELRRRDAWPQLSVQLSALERDMAGAAERLRAVRTDLDALLARRDELRGLLQAYRAMAGGRGRGEDGGLEALHQQAYDVLWRAPCDLDHAARLVADYQEAVTTGRGTSAASRGVRPTPGGNRDTAAGIVRTTQGEGKDHGDL